MLLVRQVACHSDSISSLQTSVTPDQGARNEEKAKLIPTDDRQDMFRRAEDSVYCFVEILVHFYDPKRQYCPALNNTLSPIALP